MTLKRILTISLILLQATAFGQSIIEWTDDYDLQLADFSSEQTEINKELNTYSIASGANMDFSFQMSSVQFMMTKNFNSKARTTFNRNASVITAIDSLMAQQIVKFGQFHFDLTELYTRRFRKRMFEEKGTFSDIKFFQPIFNELQEELQSETARVMKKTDLGRKEPLLKMEHQKVLEAIDELSEYCIKCKPPKKKKKS